MYSHISLRNINIKIYIYYSKLFYKILSKNVTFGLLGK